jgi:hypothetical protein
MKLKNAKQLAAFGALGAMSFGGLVATSTPASAGSSTWKKAAIAAGAVTGYGLVKGKGKVSTIGAAATAGSYYMYRKSKKKENAKKNDREARRRAWYQKRYGKNWRNHYRPS